MDKNTTVARDPGLRNNLIVRTGDETLSISRDASVTQYTDEVKYTFFHQQIKVERYTSYNVWKKIGYCDVSNETGSREWHRCRTRVRCDAALASAIESGLWD